MTISLKIWQCINRSVFFKYIFSVGLKGTRISMNENYKPFCVKNEEFTTCTEYSIIGIASQGNFQSNIQGHCLTSRE